MKLALLKKNSSGQGRISLISYKGVHQLHMCIFVLVVFHVLYSVILMALGQAKVSFSWLFKSC